MEHSELIESVDGAIACHGFEVIGVPVGSYAWVKKVGDGYLTTVMALSKAGVFDEIGSAVLVPGDGPEQKIVFTRVEFGQARVNSVSKKELLVRNLLRASSAVVREDKKMHCQAVPHLPIAKGRRFASWQLSKPIVLLAPCYARCGSQGIPLNHTISYETAQQWLSEAQEYVTSKINILQAVAGLPGEVGEWFNERSDNCVSNVYTKMTGGDCDDMAILAAAVMSALLPQLLDAPGAFPAIATGEADMREESEAHCWLVIVQGNRILHHLETTCVRTSEHLTHCDWVFTQTQRIRAIDNRTLEIPATQAPPVLASKLYHYFDADTVVLS